MRTKWGQNFLAHPPTMRRIVDALRVGPGEPVLEIGPGRGALTQYLVEQTKKVLAVELDETLAATLTARFPQIQVVQSDFLEWTLPAVAPGHFLVIGNLPYSAGGAILRKLLDWPGWSRAVVMVQQEVAHRLVAGPGGRAYGILSLAVRAKAEARCLFDVPPGAFRPTPQVMSTVVELTRATTPRVGLEDDADFFRVVRAAFNQRRKNILNALSHGLSLDRKQVEDALRQENVPPTLRAENLDTDVFLRLTHRLRPLPAV